MLLVIAYSIFLSTIVGSTYYGSKNTKGLTNLEVIQINKELKESSKSIEYLPDEFEKMVAKSIQEIRREVTDKVSKYSKEIENATL